MTHLAKEIRSHGHRKRWGYKDENKVKYVGLTVYQPFTALLGGLAFLRWGNTRN